MQSNDDLQPFFGLIASTVERSQLEKQIQFQGIPCVDQSSSDEEDLESSPSSKSDSSRTKELESSETSREWMFTGHWYFQNTYGALPDVEIEQDDKLEEMWEKMGAEIKSAFLTSSVLWIALEISSCHCKGISHKILWSSTFYAIASDRLFELCSFAGRCQE